MKTSCVSPSSCGAGAATFNINGSVITTTVSSVGVDAGSTHFVSDVSDSSASPTSTFSPLGTEELEEASSVPTFSLLEADELEVVFTVPSFSLLSVEELDAVSSVFTLSLLRTEELDVASSISVFSLVEALPVSTVKAFDSSSANTTVQTLIIIHSVRSRASIFFGFFIIFTLFSYS